MTDFIGAPDDYNQRTIKIPHTVPQRCSLVDYLRIGVAAVLVGAFAWGANAFYNNSTIDDTTRVVAESKEKRRQSRSVEISLDECVSQRLAEMSRNPELNAAEKLAYLKLARRVDYNDKELVTEYNKRARDLIRTVRREDREKEFKEMWKKLLDEHDLHDENNRFKWRWVSSLTSLYLLNNLREDVKHREPTRK